MKNENNMHEIARIAAEAGAKVALETIEAERNKMFKKNRDRRLRNTKLLLRNYRMLKSHCHNALYDLAQLEDEIDIIDLMTNVFSDSNVLVESIKHSAERTYLIINHVDEMLRLYEIYCSTSNKQEDIRRYRILHALYISDDATTVHEIACRENIDTRTVYKDIDNAVEKLTALFFGIDGINVTK